MASIADFTNCSSRKKRWPAPSGWRPAARFNRPPTNKHQPLITGEAMLKSMTGYGQGTASGDNFNVTVDLRSVNNRNLDIHWRAPQDLASLEIPLKKMIHAAVSRGRVDVTINFSQNADVAYELNRPLIRGYLEALRMMRQEFGLSGEADLAALTKLPNVLTPSTASDTLSA